MANSDKDILITPNKGSSIADPKLEFVGADASLGPQKLTAWALPYNSGTIQFEGIGGQQFSINNSSTGVIHSVNDVSGIPSIEVLDTGLIKLAEYTGNVTIGTRTASQTKLLVQGSNDGYGLDIQKTTGHAVARFYQQNSNYNTDVYINNAGSATNWLLSRRNNGETWWYNEGANPIVMHVSATERLRINQDGVTTTIKSNNTNNIVESIGSNGYGAFYPRGQGTNPQYIFFGSGQTETARIAALSTNILTFAHGQAATERFRITAEGPVVFGRTYPNNERIGLGGSTSSYTSATSATGIYDDTIISSGQTGGYTTFSQYPSTAAASFTVGQLMHFRANFFTKGAGSTITNQFGYTASGLTQATNNYGFYADMNSQANTWNTYMNGTAQNYFGGNVGIGHNNPSSFYGMDTRLLVVNNQNAATILALGNNSATAAASTQIKMVGGTGNSHTTYVLADNAGVPTASIDFGSAVTNFYLTYGGTAKFTLAPSGQVTLGAPNGTAPLITQSTTKVTNLNADLIDGLDSNALVYGAANAGSQGGPGTTWSGTHVSQYKSGFWDQSGASWTPDTGWWWGITTAHTSNSSAYLYGGQLVFQNANNPKVYIRTLNGGVTPNANPWYQVWHEGSDGVGQGLDADLLDGQQGSWYQQALVSGTNIKTIAGQSVLGSGNMTLPAAQYIGEIRQIGFSTIPTGWLLCDGSTISRTTYSLLFSVIGTAYGAGDGSTTFELPDFRGSLPIGVDRRPSASTAVVATLGDVYGSATGPAGFSVTAADPLTNNVGVTVVNFIIAATAESIGTDSTAILSGISGLVTEVAGKQPTLISGTNIKTVNSTSLLGSGNIAVEPTITAGTAAQYYRGDKQWQTLDKTSVGLSNVDNTSDANKPVSTAQQTALNAKLNLTGGTLTGNLLTLAHQTTRVAVPANNIDLNTGNFFTKTISGATTLTVSNTPTTGTTAQFILELTNPGQATITWWSGVKWAGGTAPTLTASGVDILGFYTHDGGTTWRGLVLAKDSK